MKHLHLQKISPLSFTTATAKTKIVTIIIIIIIIISERGFISRTRSVINISFYRFRRTQLPGNKAVCKQSSHKPGPVVLVTVSYLCFLKFFILLIPITTNKRIITCHFCAGSLKYVWLQAKRGRPTIFHNRVVEIVINYTDVRLCASKIFNHVIKTL